jgi:hypothetical protein
MAGTDTSSSSAASAAGRGDHVTQDERGALTRRQDLEPGDESKAHALARCHHRWVAALVDHEAVSNRLEPRHVAGRRFRRA